jgi:DNA-binding SARP family transcriptional activator
VRFAILGSVVVDGPDGPIPVTAPRELALLAELLVHAGRPVTREHLADRIWGEQEVRHPAHAVHTLVSRLRSRLGNGAIATAGRCYTLTAEDLDAARFRRLLGEARRAAGADRTEAAVDLYGRALSLWRGTALAGVPPGSRCVQAEQLQLEELRVGAVEERAEAWLRLGRHDALVGELVPLVEAYPFRERLRAALMLGLYRGGQVAEALATYRRANTELVEKYGISPGAELRRLHERMLRADPDLQPPPAIPGRLRQVLTDLEARVTDLESALAAMVDTPGRTGR